MFIHTFKVHTFKELLKFSDFFIFIRFSNIHPHFLIPEHFHHPQKE